VSQKPQAVHYRLYSGGAYKTFPFLCGREHDIRLRQCAPNYLSEGVIERAFQVMDDISDDERQTVWNWLSGCQDRDAVYPIVVRVNVNSVETWGAKIGNGGLKLIDVAVGPLNL